MYQGVTQCFIEELKLDGGWMSRKQVVEKVYNDTSTEVNAHHRAIFKQLVAAGIIIERVTGQGDRQRFEYRYVQ